MQHFKPKGTVSLDPGYLSRAVMRAEPLNTDPLTMQRLTLMGSYLSGLVRAKNLVLEQKPEVVLFPLRGAWPLAKGMQLAASLERQSSRLPLFKYPPFSSHYFSKRTEIDRDVVFHNKQQVISEFMASLKRHLGKGGRPKLMVIDEVLSGSSLTGTYGVARAFMQNTYGKGNYELTVVGICDQSHILFRAGQSRPEQLLELAREGFVAFTDKNLHGGIAAGTKGPRDIEASKGFPGNFLFTGKDIVPLVKEGRVRFKNPIFNALVSGDKIIPITVGRLFTTDSKKFLYGMSKGTREIGGTSEDYPVYSASSFDPEVQRNLQRLLDGFENILSFSEKQ
jgi:hypothetical protein